MEEFLDNEMKYIDVLSGRVTVTSALNDDKEAELDDLADAIAESVAELQLS